VLPAVDIAGAAAVRLRRGDFDRVVVRAGDPRALVARLVRRAPEFVHVVDLDGARSGRPRPGLIAELAAAAAPVGLQVGGGLRSLRAARDVLEAGAERIVVGTAAFERAPALSEWVRVFGQRLLVAIDVSNGRVRTNGWTRSAGLNLADALLLSSRAGVRRIVCTAIDRDGTLDGPDIELQSAVARGAGCAVLAAGGIRSPADLEKLAALGMEGAIVGRALFEDAAGGLEYLTPR
jgi:phosphoribosylformimino-5-aminoimidazole carboxamide ribotide isomerase